MKDILKKKKAKCAECGTPLNGDNLDERRIGDYFYCAADYERISAQEKSGNWQKLKDNEEFRRMLAR